MADTSQIVITDAGLDEIIAASQGGTEKVKIVSLGIGTGRYIALPDRKSLDAEIKRLDTVSGGAKGGNIIHVTSRDDSADQYAVYEFGLYTDKGTLFAVYSQSSPILEKSAKSQAYLAIDIIASQFDANMIQFGDTNFHNPQATTEMLGVVELATLAEVLAGIDGSRAVTPAMLAKLTSQVDRAGLIQLATLLEVEKGREDKKAVSPASLIAAFTKDHRDVGYQKLPNGLLIQWCRARVKSDGTTDVMLPVKFQTKCVVAVPVSDSRVGAFTSLKDASPSIVHVRHGANGLLDVKIVAIGY